MIIGFSKVIIVGVMMVTMILEINFVYLAIKLVKLAMDLTPLTAFHAIPA